VITISANFNSMGIVHNVTCQITDILGFKKQEIIGHKVRKIQPQVWGERHYTNLMRYFITLNATVIGIERPIFPINTKGYLVGVMIFIKILPELTNGVEVVGFLNSFPPRQEGEPDLHWMLLNMKDGVVMGITENFYNSFGMPS